MEIASTFSGDFLSPSILVAAAVTCLCCLFAVLAVRLSPREFPRGSGGASSKKACGCICSCSVSGSSGGGGGGSLDMASAAVYLNGNGGDIRERGAVVAVERQTGASMMEQLVPEITTHALSYLDYPSLCRLSMTNSLMRKAANDDSAWKALYHKDFTMEQYNLRPPDGWKAYYAATRAVVNINLKFFDIIRENSLSAMSHLWLNADYVKCIYASGENFTGYTAVMQSWEMALNWDIWVDFEIRDVRPRVLTDMAWVTMKAYVEDVGTCYMTNVFEFHNGTWYMVHHHSSAMVAGGGMGQ